MSAVVPAPYKGRVTMFFSNTCCGEKEGGQRRLECFTPASPGPSSGWSLNWCSRWAWSSVDRELTFRFWMDPKACLWLFMFYLYAAIHLAKITRRPTCVQTVAGVEVWCVNFFYEWAVSFPGLFHLVLWTWTLRSWKWLAASVVPQQQDVSFQQWHAKIPAITAIRAQECSLNSR